MLYSGFLEHLREGNRGNLHSFHTVHRLLHSEAQGRRMRKTSRCKDMLLLASSARHRSPRGLSSLHNIMLNLGSIGLLSHEGRRGKGSRVKLTGNKLNQSRAVTKGTGDISTVSHPTAWPRARNFHYNFSKGGRKGGKNVSQKPYQGPNPGCPATQPKFYERLAFQGVKTQHVEPGSLLHGGRGP